MPYQFLRIDVESVFGAALNSSAAANVSLGTLVGLNSSGEVIVANSGIDSAAVYEAKGVAGEGGTFTDSVITKTRTVMSVVRRGRITGFTGLTPAGTVYLGSGGGYTQVAPSVTAQLLQKVGFALNATDVYIDIEPGTTI